MTNANPESVVVEKSAPSTEEPAKIQAAPVLDPMKPLAEQAKVEGKVEESKEQSKESVSPPVEDKDKDPLLIELEVLQKTAANQASLIKALEEKVKNKSGEIDRTHEMLNLEKKSKDELKREVITLRNDISKRDKASWDRVNKHLDKADEGIKAFVQLVRRPDMTADELVMMIDTAKEKGLIPGIGIVPEPDSNFAVKPVSKEKGKSKNPALYNQAKQQAYFDAVNQMGKPKTT